jgi:hypothetical protein
MNSNNNLLPPSAAATAAGGGGGGGSKNNQPQDTKFQIEKSSEVQVQMPVSSKPQVKSAKDAVALMKLLTQEALERAAGDLQRTDNRVIIVLDFEAWRQAFEARAGCAFSRNQLEKLPGANRGLKPTLLLTELEKEV